MAEIGEAGYFAEEIEGENRQITIEMKPVPACPTMDFWRKWRPM